MSLGEESSNKRQNAQSVRLHWQLQNNFRYIFVCLQLSNLFPTNMYKILEDFEVNLFVSFSQADFSPR